MESKEHDIIVVGGGPAGSTTAIGCASAGMNVLLLEKGHPNRNKPCGGVLPLVAPETIEDIVGDSIPDDVRIYPTELGLYYVPPSGRKNGGRVKNYSIHNIERASFDQWLRDLARDAGADVKHNFQCVGVQKKDKFKIKIESGDGTTYASSDYLVGADGVRSTVRSYLFPQKDTPRMIVGQEHWKANGDFEDCFYGFFKEEISVAYAYLIPKADSIIIGLGAEPHKKTNIAQLLRKFKKWLEIEFSFSPKQLMMKEAWSIPFGYFIPGEGNALLVGDAAGLCNPLSGEGIRLAVESAEAAVSAIQTAEGENDPSQIYAKDVHGLASMIAELNEFVRTVDDEGRERFVKDELLRRF